MLDNPNKSFPVYYWLPIKYRWSHAFCRTDFSPNQLLHENIYDLFLLCGVDFWSCTRQQSRSRFTRCSFLSINANMWRKTNVCTFCSLITHPSFLFNCKCISFPEACIWLPFLFEEIYASLFTFGDFRCHHMWVLQPMLIFYEWSLKWVKTVWKGYKGLQGLQNNLSKATVLQTHKKMFLLELLQQSI